MTVSAPGKMVLIGDYAVVDGHLALVAAVDRRAVGRRVSAGQGAPSEVVNGVLGRIHSPQVAPDEVLVDTSTFVDPDRGKLGVGSSAAVAVVTAALGTGRGDESTFKAALEGHRDANDGQGSGIDVAASFYGGVIATRAQPNEVHPCPSRIRNLHLSVLYAGAPASTKSLVAACRASAEWSKWMNVLGPLAEQGVDAWYKQDQTRFMGIIARYGRAMAQMGRDAGVEIVTDTIQAIMDAAAKTGGAAKPS
ncbi:MAG: hypothetical protein AAF449_16365, partial [Myxococcota bacterium]